MEDKENRDIENNPMTVGELIKEHEQSLKIAVAQAYNAISMSPKINYVSLEGALRVAIDNMESIQGLLDE